MRIPEPPVGVRLLLLGALAAFAALDHNPVVRLEARLGLSPSPLERLFGIRGFFSGMTEATFRLTRLDLAGASQANILVFPVLAAATAAILLWRWPTLRTPRQELAFFAVAVVGTAVNNVV
ncbi:MAG TPA: hypothetical protein VF079_02650, partial [Sphingomicrobium sp.]